MNTNKQKLIDSIYLLYNDIEQSITQLINARLNHNQDEEGKALFKMEGLMVATEQELSCILDYLKIENDNNM